jgi:hypothetical protein
MQVHIHAPPSPLLTHLIALNSTPELNDIFSVSNCSVFSTADASNPPAANASQFAIKDVSGQFSFSNVIEIPNQFFNDWLWNFSSIC